MTGENLTPSLILTAIPNPQLRQCAHDILEQDGYLLHAASDGEKCVRIAGEIRPNLVILEQNGAESLQVCARLREASKVPILMIADPQGDSLEAVFGAGADEIATPPLKALELRQRVRLLLRLPNAHPHLSLPVRTIINPDHQYWMLLEQAADGIVVTDPEGSYLEANARMCEMTGFTRSELLSMNMRDLAHPSELLLLPLHFHEARETGQIVRAEWRLRHKSGKWLYTEINTRMLENGSCQSVVRDISERRAFEDALRNSEQKYRHLFEYATDSIFIIDVETSRVIEANRNAAKRLGYRRDELLKLTLEDIEAGEATAVAESTTSLGKIVYEHYHRRKDGSVIPVESSSHMATYDGRQVVINFTRDITQRKAGEAAEKDLRLIAEALREAASVLTSTLDLEEIYQRVLEQVSKVVQSESTNLMMIEDGVARVVAYRGDPRYVDGPALLRLRLPVESTANLAWMAQHRRPFVIQDTLSYEGWIAVKPGENTRSSVGVPLQADGQVIGYINLNSAMPGAYAEVDLDRLELFANQASIAIQNARLHQAVQRHATELEQQVIQRTAQLSESNAILQEQIREREKAQEALNEERTLLRTIIDNIPDLVYAKDREGRYIMANIALARFYGLTHPDQVLGKTALEISPHQHSVDWEVQYVQDEENVILRGEIVSREDTFMDLSIGSKRWYQITKVPLRDPENKIIGLVGVNHDVTHMREAEEQLRQIVSSARCLMWYAIVEEKNDQLRWTFFISNEEAAQEFLPLDLARGQSYTEVWRTSRLPEDRRRIKRTSTKAIRSGRLSYSQEFRIRQKDGTVRWLSEDAVIKPLTPGRWSVIGVCTDVTERKQAFAELELRVQQRTAELSQANEALKEEIAERKRAEEAERKRSSELETLWQASLTLNSSLDLKQVLKEILRYSLKLVRATDANIFLYDGERLTFGASLMHGEFKDRPYSEPRSDGLTYAVARSGERIIVPDMRSHPLFASSSWRGAILGLPLQVGEHVCGVMNIAYENQPHEFDEYELRILELLADQAAAAINSAQYIQQIEAESAERKRAEEAERDQRMLAEALRSTAVELSGTLDINEVMDRILENVARVVRHDAACIMLIEGDVARIVRHRGYPEDLNLRLPLRDAANLRHIMRTGEPFVIPEIARYSQWQWLTEPGWLSSNVVAPIKLVGMVIGFISLESRTVGAFTEDDARRLQAFASQAGIAFENARLYEAVQKHAIELEQRVRERTAQLERERAQLQALLDAMGEGVSGTIIEDDGTQTRIINKALSDMTGYDPDDWDVDLFRLAAINAEDYPAFMDEVANHLRQNNVWRGELHLRRKDGSILNVSVTSTAVRATDGRVIGSVTIVRDISQEKQLQERQARFIASASHELRTPLANIMTRLYLIRRQPERLDEHLTVMEMVSQRMKSLIEDLLDLSRFERGMISLTRERLVLQKLVDEVVRVQKSEAHLKDIELLTSFSVIPLLAMVDAKRLSQVMTNLLTNAINYTPEGGRIRVSIARDPENARYARIQVADTGIGISPEMLPFVFNPFFRATDQAQGTGLGLSITKEIVDLHNGHIDVESQVGEGTCFSVKLPLLN